MTGGKKWLAWVGVVLLGYWLPKWLSANDASEYGVLAGLLLGVVMAQLAGPLWPSTSAKEASILDKN